MPKHNRVNKKVSHAHASYSSWKSYLMTVSVAFNILVVLFLIFFLIGYGSGNSYQTKELARLYFNQCSYYLNNHVPSAEQVSRTVNAKTQTAVVMRLNQSQLDSGCYSYLIASAETSYYRELSSKNNVFVPLIVGPSGQSLENIPALNVFLQPSP